MFNYLPHCDVDSKNQSVIWLDMRYSRIFCESCSFEAIERAPRIIYVSSSFSDTAVQSQSVRIWVSQRLSVQFAVAFTSPNKKTSSQVSWKISLIDDLLPKAYLGLKDNVHWTSRDSRLLKQMLSWFISQIYEVQVLSIPSWARVLHVSSRVQTRVFLGGAQCCIEGCFDVVLALRFFFAEMWMHWMVESAASCCNRPMLEVLQWVNVDKHDKSSCIQSNRSAKEFKSLAKRHGFSPQAAEVPVAGQHPQKQRFQLPCTREQPDIDRVPSCAHENKDSGQ